MSTDPIAQSGGVERPAAKRRQRRFVIGKVADFPDGSSTVVDVNGRSIGVYNFGGRFSALLNRCPHQGGPLCVGVPSPLVDSDEIGDVTVDYDRVLVACPWHGWEFDVVDGQSYLDPTRFRVKPYAVDVERGKDVQDEIEQGQAAPVGRQLIQGPYKAEVVEVEVDDDYVVVQLR